MQFFEHRVHFKDNLILAQVLSDNPYNVNAVRNLPELGEVERGDLLRLLDLLLVGLDLVLQLVHHLLHPLVVLVVLVLLVWKVYLQTYFSLRDTVHATD